MADVVADGRVRRGERNRAAIVDALLSLYDEGELRPSALQVAQRAGVSPRSVHNHFADMESLRASVAQRQWERHAAYIEEPPSDGPLDKRIDVVVQRRSALYDEISGVRRAALLSVYESPEIAKQLARVSRLMRKYCETAFAPELARAERAETVLDAIDLLTSWEAWERLRTQQRLNASSARRVITSTLHALLDPYDAKDHA